MTKSSSGLLFGATLALIVTAAQAAETTSANDVMPGCRKFALRQAMNANEAILGGLCAGIIRGIAYTGSLADLIVEGFQDDKRGPYQTVKNNLCIAHPDEATLDQMIRVVIAYIDARPARRREKFDDLALEALTTAWPCK